MPSEFALDLCFIREHSESPYCTIIEQQLHELFTEKGTWYLDVREEQGLDIAVVEVKGLALWETEDELLGYIEVFVESNADSEYDCWNHLHGYQAKVSPKVDAGCCRLKKEVHV